MDEPAHILVVDDDEETVTLLREILSKEGYSVDIAGDGKIALDKINSRSPDLVISDIHMPDLDGMGLLAELRVRHQDVPMILMTAYGSLKTAVDGLRSGAFDYLSKPFIVDDIRLVVRRALEHKFLSRQNQALKEQRVALPAVRQTNARRIQIATATEPVPPALQAMFSILEGKSRMVPDPKAGAFFIVRVTKVTPGNALLQPGLISRMQNELQQATADDYASQLMSAIRAEMKVRRNESAIAAEKQRLRSTAG